MRVRLFSVGVFLFFAFAWCRTILPQLPDDIRRLRHGAKGTESRTIVLGWLITVLTLVLIVALIGPRLATFVRCFQ
jgi:Na+/H+ antiporter NhaD/arsenite permease-like protein